MKKQIEQLTKALEKKNAEMDKNELKMAQMERDLA